MHVSPKALVISLIASCAFFAGCPGSPDAHVGQDVPLPGPAGQGGGRFSVNDKIKVQIKDTPDTQLQLPHITQVRENGMITLPYIGDVQADGKTSSELQKEITAKFVPAYFTRVTVTVEPDERYYFVGGEVKQESQRAYLGTITVTRAIRAAGGFTDFAAKAKVKLTRASGEVIEVNVPKAMKDPRLDPLVYPGDQIHVPRSIW